MLVSTKFRKLDNRFNILNESLENLDKDKDKENLKVLFSKEYDAFSLLYLEFLKLHNVYFKGNEFDNELDRISKFLIDKTDEILKLSNEKKVREINENLCKIEKDKRFAIYKIQKVNIIIGILSILSLVTLLLLGLDMDHPFTLLLLALSIPLLTSQLEHRIIYYCGSVLTYFLLFYSLMNLPTPAYVKIIDGVKVNENVSKTLLDKATKEIRLLMNLDWLTK